ncbi:HNH endonuclease signature motif containing protein, partial [Brachybacterium sp. YJGR34]|uniref:HNH endonuclease signature motif containing protein n=1 Tax=Brachybacterium sp. YJGR34 TaxID=2059911 RepID=UPI0018E62C1F
MVVVGEELHPEDPAPVWRVRAREPLTAQRVLEEAEVGAGTEQAGRVLALHENLRAQARLLARQYRLLSAFAASDEDVTSLVEDADLTAMKVATGLRTTASRAQGLVRDAHRAVHELPEAFARLERGEMPAGFHHYLIRRSRRLTDAQAEAVDGRLAGVEVSAVSVDTWEREVRHAVATATADTPPVPPSAARCVELVNVDPVAGTAALSIIGPIPEITALMHRLDESARTVSAAQRTALETGDEAPIPFDLDDDLRARGRPASRAALRYAILTHTLLDTDPVEESRQVHKLLVTVPVTTLLGIDDTPAMLEGATPIPAQQARELAAGCGTWQRILTDPITGAYLPVTAQTYQPTAQMRLQLRLRHPVCAAPGCTRPTILAAEDDHLLPYDHTHPGQGGQTSLWNLHRLCWRHHQLKTTGHITPTRDPDDDPATQADGSTRTGPLETRWMIDTSVRTRTREATDL